MPKRREVFESLSRQDLLDLADFFAVNLESKTKLKVAETLTNNRKIKLEDALAKLSLTTLKELCQTFELDSKGRKADLVERLNEKPKAAPKVSRKKTKEVKVETEVEVEAEEKPKKGVTGEDTDTTARPNYKDRVIPKELQEPDPRVCVHCRKKVDLKKCQVHNCAHVFPGSLSWKICAECLFERGGLSFEEFSERHHHQTLCPHCHKAWQSRSKSA